MSNIKTAMTLLENMLQGTLLPTEKGGCRRGSPDEFMLMLPEPKNGWYQFKHCHTRNYIFIHVSGKVEIPTGRPFMQGFFDVPPDVA